MSAPAAVSRPLLFSASMVRALLAGTKTQTRRALKYQPIDIMPMPEQLGRQWVTLDQREPEAKGKVVRCRFGLPGDLLWVRETWRVSNKNDGLAPRDLPHARGMTVMFAAGGSRAHDDTGQYVNDDAYPESLPDWAGKLRPSIHMPRWASRITLRITDVRVERLQEITEADAIAEGIRRAGRRWEAKEICVTPISASDAYRGLWEYINGPGSWAANPWVWAVAFERVKP